MSTGTSSSAPTSTTTQTGGLAPYAQPYAENLLGQGAALTNLQNNPYQSYPGQQIAGQTALQEQANQGIAGLGVAPQTTAASGIAQGVANQAQNFQYNAPQYQSMGLDSLNVNAPGLQNFDMNAAQNQYNPNLQNYQMQQPGNVTTGQFTDPNQAAQYMSPYFQNVVDFQSQEAQRQSDIQKNQIDSQAAAAGAFGGSRGALMQSQRLRDLATQQGGIAATGAQNAYQAAQQAYMTDQARALQAAQGNQQIGYQTGAQNLAANLGVQQLGTQTGLQTSLANQQAQQQAAAANQQAQLGVQALGSGQSMQAQQANQAAQLQAQQQALSQNQALNQQNLANAQNAAQFGLAGLGAQNTAAQTLGGLGQQQSQQQLAINQAQQQAGAAQQQTQQNQLTAQYQDFLNNLNYPYKQLGFMQGLLQGQPQAQTNTVYQAPPTTMQNLSSLGLTAGGIGALLKALGKEGGLVKGMSSGGITSLMPDQQIMQSQSVPEFIKPYILNNRTQLRNAAVPPPAPVTAMPSQMVAAQQQQPQGPLDKGLGQLQADPTMGMADGGIVGYASGGPYGFGAWSDALDKQVYGELGIGDDVIFAPIPEAYRAIMENSVGRVPDYLRARGKDLANVISGIEQAVQPVRTGSKLTPEKPLVPVPPPAPLPAPDASAASAPPPVPAPASDPVITSTAASGIGTPPAVKIPDTAPVAPGPGPDMPTLEQPKKVADMIKERNDLMQAVKDPEAAAYLAKRQAEEADLRAEKSRAPWLGIASGLFGAAGAMSKPGQPYFMQALGSGAEAFGKAIPQIEKATNDANKALRDYTRDTELFRQAERKGDIAQASDISKRLEDNRDKYQTAQLKIQELKQTGEYQRAQAAASTSQAASQAALVPSTALLHERTGIAALQNAHASMARTNALIEHYKALGDAAKVPQLILQQERELHKQAEAEVDKDPMLKLQPTERAARVEKRYKEMLASPSMQALYAKAGYSTTIQRSSLQSASPLGVLDDLQ